MQYRPIKLLLRISSHDQIVVLTMWVAWISEEPRYAESVGIQMHCEPSFFAQQNVDSCITVRDANKILIN